jgi:hypothetical protein
MTAALKLHRRNLMAHAGRNRVLASVVLGLALLAARPARAYSVLAHQATVDAAWDELAVPLLRRHFPRATVSELVAARAYAYGGSLIQDLGYYPFGSHLFTDLTHYVRSGDFVAALLRNARDVNEYAFALGALAHYSSDNAGHPMAVNRAVPLVYPKIRREVGDAALYVDSPKRHVMVEFAFDVLQVARGAYVQQAYRERIGFEVSERVLDAAMRDTYGLALDDLLVDVDLAIGTYRRAVSTTIPEMTRIAWREKRDEIEERTPGVTRQAFVFAFSGRDYDDAFGTKYRKPGLFSRVLAFMIKIIPKIGPLRVLAFEPLTPEAERLFLQSVAAAHARYRDQVRALGRGRLTLSNTDFDTGLQPRLGSNPLADKTYAALLDKLADRKFDGVPLALQRQVRDYFRGLSTTVIDEDLREDQPRIQKQLALLSSRAR